MENKTRKRNRLKKENFTKDKSQPGETGFPEEWWLEFVGFLEPGSVSELMLGWAVQQGKQDPLEVTHGATCPVCSSVHAAWRVPTASFLVDCRGGSWRAGRPCCSHHHFVLEYPSGSWQHT